MDKNQAIRLLDDTFNNDFDVNKFAKFIKNLFNNFEVSPKSWTVWEAFQEYIESFQLLGSYEHSKKVIDVLAVKLRKTGSVDRARTMQRNFIAKWLGNAEKEAALVAFYGDDPQDWRFSFVKMEYQLVKETDGKVKIAKELTPAKRYSFLVGVNEPNYTCKSQFVSLLLQEEVNPTLEEIEAAFTIDKVTKEFFMEYKELYLKLKEAVEDFIKKDKNIKEEFEDKAISIVDFTKKLLGQIVFIYFLQKKGWLGVEKDSATRRFKDWGTGQKNFLRRLFNQELIKYKNFYREVLEPLFYSSLATDRSADDDYDSHFKCKIPFLNGGLFEPMNEYNWRETDLLLSNDIFERILNTFDRYNFTVKEDEPLEKEVAIDPEMLGKVFENLIEENIRKGQGAYYTPREIVHYMCQQSLVNYLETNTAISREDIEKFIKLGDFATEILIMDKKKTKIYGRSVISDEEHKLPKSIRVNYAKIDELLKNIKIVDPAVGSGAFPVGMMNEIVKARSILSILFSDEEQKKRTNYNLKREIIENCLYGVDIDSSAIDITKLRFWLSLIVDEMDMKNIQPLPNLDHKIMCGNSLLEEFEGHKLFDDKLLGEVKKDYSFEIKQVENEIAKFNQELHEIHTGRIKNNNGRIQQIQKEIKRLQKKKEQIISAPKEEEQQVTINDSLQKRIKESAKKFKELQSMIKELISEQNRRKKRELLQKIDALEWGFIEETLKEQGCEESIKKLEQYKKNKSKPFFLWKLYFSEVFQRENPGFDVVIGNPPYVQLQKDHGRLADMYKNCNYKSFERTGDIYTLFYESGINMLKTGGHLCFITSNKWMRTGYGKSLRKFFNSHNPLLLVDLGPGIFENATVDTNILIIGKDTNEGKLAGVTLNAEVKDTILSDFINKNKSILPNMGEDAWFIGNQAEQNLKSKIGKIGKPLKDWGVNIYRGVLTGLNEAFIIDTPTKERICQEDPKSAEILKPILRGRDIKRYRYEWTGLWIIASGFDINVPKLYPAVYKHLLQFEEKAKKRDDQGQNWWNLRSCAYYSEFEKEKVVYPNMTKYLPFIYDNENFYTNQKCFILTAKCHLKYLTGYFNSSISQRWIRNNCPELQGGTRELSKIFFENIPIPPITSSNKDVVAHIENIVEKLLSAKKQNPQADTCQSEREIDQLVYKLYELTPEEIKVVEGFGKER